MQFAQQRRGGNRSSQPNEPVSVAGRVPPHDLDAEAAVLSAVLLDATRSTRSLEILKPEHFYTEANRRIFEAAHRARARGHAGRHRQVASWLRDRERLAQVGGAALPRAARRRDARRRARRRVRATSSTRSGAIRQLISTCQRVAAEGYGDFGEVQEFIDGAEQAIYDIARTPRDAERRSRSTQVLKTAFEQITDGGRARRSHHRRLRPASTLDAKTAGLHEGDLTIVAARPGMGKTRFVLNIAVERRVAAHRQRAPVPAIRGHGAERKSRASASCVFSLEMPREQLANRMVCSEARVDVSKMRTGLPAARRTGASSPRPRRFLVEPADLDRRHAGSRHPRAAREGAPPPGRVRTATTTAARSSADRPASSSTTSSS